jgi:AcrR family transcriptional regulator
LFNERGFGVVSVDEIASAAGVTKPTFYYHFSSKNDAFIAGIQAMAGRARNMIAHTATFTEFSVMERLRRAIGQRRAILDVEPVLAFDEGKLDEAMSYLNSNQQREMRHAFETLHAPLRQLMAEGVASGEFRQIDPDILAVCFRQLFQPTTYHALAHAANPAEIDAQLLEFFWQGARNPNTRFEGDETQ